jgi:hypothetical protein
VKGTKVHVSGRLYAIDNFSFSNSDKSGLITATLALDAFVYGTAPAVPTASTVPGGDTSTDTTSTDTTTTTGP